MTGDTRLLKAFPGYATYAADRLWKGSRALAKTFRHYGGSVFSGNYEHLVKNPGTRETFNCVAGVMMTYSLVTVLGISAPALLATTALSTAYYLAVRRQLQRAAAGKKPDDAIFSAGGRNFTNRHLNRVLGAGFAFATFFTVGGYVLSGINAAVQGITSPLVMVPWIEHFGHALRWVSETLTSATDYVLPLGTAFLSAVAGNHFYRILSRNDRYPEASEVRTGPGWTLSARAIEARQMELRERRQKSTITGQIGNDIKYVLMNLGLGLSAVAAAALYNDTSQALQHISEHPTSYAQLFAFGLLALPVLRRLTNIAAGVAVFAATGYLTGVFDPSPLVDLFANGDQGILENLKDIGLSLAGYGQAVMESLWNIAPAAAGYMAYALPYTMWRKLAHALYRTGKFFADTFRNPYQAVKDNVFSRETYIELGNLFLDALWYVSKPLKRPLGWIAGAGAAITVFNYTGMTDVGL